MATIYSHLKHTQKRECTKYGELVCFTWKNNSSLIYRRVSAICSSQNVQTVLDFTSRVFQHLGCQRSSCTVDSCTKFNCTTNFWTEYLVLYIASKEKSNGVISGSEGAKALGLSRPVHVFGKLLFRDSYCKATVWRDTILLKENVRLKVCHLRDCKWLKHIEIICTVHGPLLKEEGSSHLMSPSHAGHCLSLETVPTTAWWTVFQVLVLNIPDGNVIALE
jgi:hypothetical protein